MNFTPAEVLEVIYTDSVPNLIYGIKAKLMDNNPYGDANSTAVITAKPFNINVVRIPIVGEIVMIVDATNSFATALKPATTKYYLDIISLQTSIHHNALPTATKFSITKDSGGGDSNSYNEASAGSTKKESEPEIDKNFSENDKVKPLQHYVGDLIVSGRFGQSIRFSTTPKSGDFKVSPKWSKGDEGAPIAIYRSTFPTKQTNKFNDFVTEDFANEDNVIVQASGQEIEFEQASKRLTAIKAAEITSWQEENWGQTPQTLISAGRLVFNSTQKEIIAFAKNGIGLSSESNIAMDAADTITLNAPTIELGNDAQEPVILGQKWSQWTNELITAIGTITVITSLGPSAPISSAPQWGQIAAKLGQLNSLLSQVTKTK